MPKCVNCLTTFELKDGFSPFYCSEMCATSKNGRKSPAVIDDGYALLRAAHKAEGKNKTFKTGAPDGKAQKQSD